MSDRKTVYLRGKLYWAKIFDLVPNYAKDGMEWTFEVEPDADSVKILKQEGLLDRLKDVKPLKDGSYTPGREGTKFIRLTQRQFNSKGEENKPIKIVDGLGEPWDGGKLGNETVADVKITVVDYGRGKKKGVYPQAIRVLDHVPYEDGDGFAPLTEDDKYYDKAIRADDFKKDFGLDDDLDDDVI